MEKKVIKIYCDGGARGNPGKSAYAFIVFLNGKIIYKESRFLGIKTNNEAEYSAVLGAINWLTKNPSSLIDNKLINFYLDSELVAKQLRGDYKVKNENLRKYINYYNKVDTTLRKRFLFINIPRAENRLADKLVNEELDNLNLA